MTISAYRKRFPDRNTLLVVIHAANERQVIRNIQIAASCQAHGVFLVNHRISANAMLGIYQELLSNSGFPQSFWVGMNFLDLETASAFKRVPAYLGGVWGDNAGISLRESQQAFYIDKAREYARDHLDWQGLYFGGVAFKHQAAVAEADLRETAILASCHMDVVTTSGPGTGIAADVRKIETMRNALDDFPLAVASGITPENFKDYRDLVDCFLVATGISTSFYELDPARVSRLVEQVRS